MAMIINQEFCQELRSKRFRCTEQKELPGLVLQTVTNFQRSPCETNIIRIVSYLTGTD